MLIDRMPRRWTTGCVTALALLVAGAACGDEPQEDAIFAASRTAVAAGQVAKTPMAGFSIVRTPFQEIPAQGTVLVGFDIGIGKFIDDDAIYALRPIYRTAKGTLVTSQEFGSFNPQQGRKRPNPRQLPQTQRVVAKPGYAVGEITLRSSLYISGLSVRYMRISGQSLDPRQTYATTWVGSQSGDRETKVSGNGAPIVGVFGSMDERRVMALGLVYLPNLVPMPPPAPARPPAGVVEPPRVEAPEPPVADQAPPEPAPIAPAPEGDVPPAPIPKLDGTTNKWMLVMTVGLLVAALAFACMLLGQKSKSEKPDRPAKASGRKGPPPLPPPDDNDTAAAMAATDATAICVRPGAIPPRLRPDDFAADDEEPVLAEVVDRRENAIGLLQPPHFSGQLKTRHCRVYVLPDELLFLDAGPANADQVMGLAVGMGGVIGGLIGAVVANAKRSNAKSRQWELNLADTDQLRTLAHVEKGNLAFMPDELDDVRLDAPTAWQSFFGGNPAGWLRFHHPDHGDVELRIATPLDMRTAEQELGRLLGRRFIVNARWHEAKQRHVPMT